MIIPAAGLHPEARAVQRLEQPSSQLEFEDICASCHDSIWKCARIDFGGIYVGSPAAPAAGRVTMVMRFGQELNEDGSACHQLRANCVYEEYMILSGGWDTLSQFDYKSFRYVDLEP